MATWPSFLHSDFRSSGQFLCHNGREAGLIVLQNPSEYCTHIVRLAYHCRRLFEETFLSKGFLSGEEIGDYFYV